MNIVKTVRKNCVNIPGWHTNRKIIVIESDDWGSIRMPSRDVYDLLLSKSIPVDKHYFLKYDCLENEEDLYCLFKVLSKFKDVKGNSPVVTALSVVANPDFEKIYNNSFNNYHYEILTETYNRYPNHYNVMKYWLNEGITKKLLWPQYHGREHLNSVKWLRRLRSNDPVELIAFSNKVLLGLPDITNNRSNSYMAAFEYSNEKEMINIEQMTIDGLKIFEKLFGFKSLSFAASQSIQGEHLNPVLFKQGVKYHQLGKQFIPKKNGKLKVKNRFWGQKNKCGQIYWRRNSNFEPSRNQNFDWVTSCMEEINIAFKWGKPAVISSHRVNYIGSIFPENRKSSLIKLNDLFKSILNKWPDVEFMNSQELGVYLTNDIESKNN